MVDGDEMRRIWWRVDVCRLRGDGAEVRGSTR